MPITMQCDICDLPIINDDYINDPHIQMSKKVNTGTYEVLFYVHYRCFNQAMKNSLVLTQIKKTYESLSNYAGGDYEAFAKNRGITIEDLLDKACSGT